MPRGSSSARCARTAEPFDDAIAGAVALLSALRAEEEHP
ncbi:hypothetical protein J2S43_002762 [Catenuloplanes nepalensis]|uniref:Uncharacterized protein n=1 Tax=Catenuloplanes nepalensis TaxID=587533 RepID=A0ABT9MS59_9ACTN|nr:hypothetical protein [Catenuloplanes nepalensis]